MYVYFGNLKMQGNDGKTLPGVVKYAPTLILQFGITWLVYAIHC